MATGIISSNGVEQYGIYHYIVDTAEEKDKLRKTDKMGSTVYVTGEQKEYILNGKKEWVEKIPTQNKEETDSNEEE